jgi:hypothetical protein
MKTTKFLFVLLAFVGLMMSGCTDEQSPVAPIDQNSLEKVIIIPFTSVNFPVAILDPGTVKVEDGKWIIRKIKIAERMNTVPAQYSGLMVHYLSGTLDYITGEGLVWGSFTIIPDDPNFGGVWEGSYNGQRTRTGASEWQIPLKTVGHGKGGTLQGMQIFGNTIITAYDTPPTAWSGVGEGYIKSNGN